MVLSKNIKGLNYFMNHALGGVSATPIMIALVLLTCLINTNTASATELLDGTGVPAQESNKSFRPNDQKEVFADADTISIELESTQLCDDCSGGISFQFGVKNELNGTLTEFSIENETAQIDDIIVTSPTRAVVIGSVSGTVRSVNIIDTEKGTVIDFFLCHFPKVSKKSQYIAYVRLIPRFSSFSEQSYVYLVYDLDKTPGENRVRMNEGFDDLVNVGIPIYPQENRINNAYQLSIDDESSLHDLGSIDIYWLTDNIVSFVDRSKGENTLVIVDISSDDADLKIRSIPIETMDVVDIDNCRESGDAPGNLVQVKKISLIETDVVRLKFKKYASCIKSKTLDIFIGEQP